VPRLPIVTLLTMPPQPVSVFFPCHTLDDFPTWLAEAEADALLAAWTAAWHPAVITAAGCRPGHASVDLPAPAEAAIGIVPPFCDERFAGQADSDDARGWVRGIDGLEASVDALARGLGATPDASGTLPGSAHADDFFALGLGTLLAELLARRMRSEPDFAATGLDAAAVAAAQAAVTGDDEGMQRSLAEAFACLDATRARYYPVESWVIDLVLAAPTTSGRVLVDALASPVPVALVATGATIRRLAERSPDAVAAMRDAIQSGRVEACGGRDDERPLDACAPEEIAASFAAGRAAWRDHLGTVPTCYAAIAGGASAIMPQILAGTGSTSAIWSLFDGTPLPDPGGSRIRQESGGCGIEAIARAPLDSSRSDTVLRLAETLGDTIDHDHTAIIAFAAYAGAASRWHRLLRRLASHCTLIGGFVTPSTLVERSAGSSIAASFEPDAFCPTQPPSEGVGEAIMSATTATRASATQLMASHTQLRDAIGLGQPRAASAASPVASSRRGTAGRSVLAGLFGRRRDDDARALDNGLVRLVANPRTGGILSLRRPVDRGNRISQQLAVRTTAAHEGSRWSAPEDRAEWTRMEADAIDREGSVADGAIVSRGRLVDESGREAGRFRQRVTLVPGLPLAMLDIEMTSARPCEGPLQECHLASRFAWHENEDAEIARSLHLQSIVTERTLFTAPHFIEIISGVSRTGSGSGSVTILTGGLPWHLRSSPHVVDCVLGAGGGAAAVRVAVGVGLERPWDAALALASGVTPSPTATLPANIRLTAEPPGVGGDRAGSLSLGLMESAGRSGDVRIDWGRRIARAVAVDLEGRPLPDVHVAVDGQATVVFLNRFQWLHLVLEWDDREVVQHQ